MSTFYVGHVLIGQGADGVRLGVGQGKTPSGGGCLGLLGSG